MRPAHLIFRLWGVRHLRAVILTYRINRHYSRWAEIGMLPTHADSDFAVVDRIRKGEL